MLIFNSKEKPTLAQQNKDAVVQCKPTEAFFVRHLGHSSSNINRNERKLLDTHSGSYTYAHTHTHEERAREKERKKERHL